MILKEIEQRQSVRQFSDKKISDEDIKQILEAGRLAPSWMNVQPWHFIVVDNDETKTLLSQSANNQKQIKDASHIIVMLGDFSAWNNKNFGQILAEKGIPEEGVQQILSNKGYNPAKNTNAVLVARTMEQCSYAVSFMSLQAEHLNIGNCIIGAFANELTGFNPEIAKAVREKLNIPNDMIIAGMLTLGYKRDTFKQTKKTRKTKEEVIFYGQYK